jgi:hypothetical protein
MKRTKPIDWTEKETDEKHAGYRTEFEAFDLRPADQVA